MKIAVVGAGALGLYYGAMLQKAGNDVHFLLRRDYDAIIANGLKVNSADGDFFLPVVHGHRTTGEIGCSDLVIVGLKTSANHRFQELLPPLVGNGTIILTLQNGLGNEEQLATLFGRERVLGGVAYLCSNRGEPGVVNHLGEGRIVLGEFRRGETALAEKIAKLFSSAGIGCRVTEEVGRARWEKLVWNIPFNGLCALMLKSVDVLLGHADTRELILKMMVEVIEGANSQGFLKEIPLSLAEKMVVSSEKLGCYRPSMLIDRLEGRPLELDAMFGAPLLAAGRQGRDMPLVRALHALLQLAEKG